MRFAVNRITAVSNSRGQATDGADRNLMFRLSVYWSMEMARLIAARPIQTCGLPGIKKSIAVLFQAAISQIWCHRNNTGTASTEKTSNTTPMVL